MVEQKIMQLFKTKLWVYILYFRICKVFFIPQSCSLNRPPFSVKEIIEKC